MKFVHALRTRLRLLFRGEAEERMEEELRFHLEMEAEKYVRGGMRPAEARRRAVLAFGGVEGHKEAMRDGRTFAWTSSVSLDFKLGFRMLRKYPGLTAVGGLAMAFAIWVGASAFEFLTQVVSPAIPLEEGHRIVGIRNWDASASRSADPSPHDFASWRDGLRTVDELGAFRTAERNLTAPNVVAGPIEVAEMSAAGFRVARVRPLLGRALSEEDERPGAPAVAVIGHEVWRTRFAGDPAVVGRSVRLGSDEATVVGVMPEGFAFPVSQGMWVPLRLDVLDRAAGELGVFGRLAPGASLREAQSELSIVGRRAASDAPETHRHLRPRVMPYAKSIMGLSRMESVGLMSMNLFVVILLVLVCGNVALLLFARAATRESEIVLRNALGASRGRIVAQLFTEALVLAGVAAVAGLAAARFGLRLVHGLVENGLLQGQPLPFWFHASLSPRTVLYALLLTALCALIAGVLPAMKVTRGLGTRLRRATAGGGRFQFGGVWTAVIVAQIAITVLFPVMALATQRDMAGLRSVEAGFAEAEFLSMRLEMDAAAPADTSRASLLARRGAAYRALERRLEADPRVQGVTFADRLPRMQHPPRVVELDEGGQAAPDPRWPGHRVRTASVDTDFFRVLETPILLGRGFHPGDLASGARPVIVNQPFVDRVLGGRNPIGRRMRYTDDDRSAEPWHEIVGVVGDLGMSLGEGAAGFYHPAAPGAAQPAHLAIHVRGDPRAFAPGLHAIAAAADPALRLHDVVPMDALSDPEIRFLGTWFWLIAGFSALAILLALAGIYAVMAFTVAQRTREIGIRVALGADARRIVAAIFRRPLTQVAIGITAGGFVTAVLPSLVGGEITGTLVAVAATQMVVTMAICMLACIVPTRRALAVDPGEALRAF
jgi:predicted permease